MLNIHQSTFFPARERFLVFCLVFLQLILLSRIFWVTNPPGLIMPVVRVLAPESELVHTHLSPYGPGFERELVELFAKQADFHPVWLHVQTPKAAWPILKAGHADLLIGVGDIPKSDLQTAVSRQVVAGPIYVNHPVAIVHQHQHNGLSDSSDLCGLRLIVPNNPALQQVSFNLLKEQNCPVAILFTDDGPLPLQFAAMQQTESRFALVDTGRFRMWKPFFPEIQISKILDTSIGYRWFWGTHQRRMNAALETFWEKKLHSEALAALLDKYFGFLPKQIDRFALDHFVDRLRYELPRFNEVIAKAAKRYDIDPLLLIALIYHESRFDTHAVSRTGVRGIMQITQATAQSLGIDNPEDPRQSILAGARYLRQLWERLDREDLAYWDRWFLALSAYNQGLGHTWDAMDLAKNLGLRETSWKNVKQVFPLLSRRKYYSKTRHGFTRGREAVAHVEAVRYYYYILHGLFNIGRDEGEHLGRLGLTGWDS